MGQLNQTGRDRIRILYESDTPLLSREALDSIVTQLKDKGTLDKRLKVIINNLPGEAQGKTGTFILHEMKKHGIIPNETDRKDIQSLDDKKLALDTETTPSSSIAEAFPPGLRQPVGENTAWASIRRHSAAREKAYGMR